MKVKLKVTAYIGEELAKAGSIHELKNGADLIEKGMAIEVADVQEDAPTNEEIINGLNLNDDEKAYLLENIGDAELALKKDGTLNKKSEDEVNAILDGMDEE